LSNNLIFMSKSCFILLVLCILCLSLKAQTRISVNDAMKHLNETCIIVGKVVQVRDAKGGIFLYLDVPYPDNPMRIMIGHDYLPAFPEKPEKLYSGKKIAILGRIQPPDKSGKPRLMIRKPSDIKIFE
jgi:hypothetical protein